MNKYLTNKKYLNGDIITKIFEDLYQYLINDNENINILFIRTPTTGAWLDVILKDNINIIRILYKTHININTNNFHSSTMIINHNELFDKLTTINKNYDIICIDPFHEYEYSISDFNLISSFLTENGIILSHDCFPMNKQMSEPKFKHGNWCGETYIAFIEFSYNNPDYFYSLLKIDTGIGIISKKQNIINYTLNNIIDKNKQKILIDYKKDNYINIYDYFINNYKSIMNIIE
jgi:hypothetical protein